MAALMPPDYKQTAKRVLRDKYWWCLLACLVVTLLGGVTEGVDQIPETREGAIFTLFELAWTVPGIFVIHFFLANPIEVGVCRYLYRSTVEKRPFSEVFFAFGPYYLRIVTVMLVRDLKIFLWTLLLIVPGIVKEYEYFAIPYLLAEKPELTVSEAFSLTSETMFGNKWRLFELYFSFIGWYFLAALTAGIGAIFLVPYVRMSATIFYIDVRPPHLSPSSEE